MNKIHLKQRKSERFRKRERSRNRRENIQLNNKPCNLTIEKETFESGRCSFMGTFCKLSDGSLHHSEVRLLKQELLGS